MQVAHYINLVHSILVKSCIVWLKTPLIGELSTQAVAKSECMYPIMSKKESDLLPLHAGYIKWALQRLADHAQCPVHGQGLGGQSSGDNQSNI